MAATVAASSVLSTMRLTRADCSSAQQDGAHRAHTQQVGVSYVIPLAIDVVERDPFAESRFYPGDLLYALLQIPTDYWVANEELRHRLQHVYERAESDDRAKDELWNDKFAPRVKDAYARFRGDLPSTDWLRLLENQQEFGTWSAGQPDPNWRIELVRAAARLTE